MKISVADISLEFCLRESVFTNKLIKRYAYFLTLEPPFFFFETLFVQKSTVPFKPKIKIADNILYMKRGDFDCSLNLKTKKGKLEISPKIQSFDSFLRTFLSWHLIRNGGFLIHSASAVINGRGYLFAGKSGAGKSTLSKIVKDMEFYPEGLEQFGFGGNLRGKKNSLLPARYPASPFILTDELSILRIIGDKIKIYPSPFWGEMKQGYGANAVSTSEVGSIWFSKKPQGWKKANEVVNRAAVDLKKIFFLKKSGKNKVFPVNRGEFCKSMMGCVMNFSKEKTDSLNIMRSLAKISKRADYSKLYFSKAGGFENLLRD